jgi:hypothetical protein
MEGTGYLDMLEQGPRYEAPPEERKPGDPATEVLPLLEGDAPPAGGAPVPNNGSAPFTPIDPNNIVVPDNFNPNALPGLDLPALPNTSPTPGSNPARPVNIQNRGTNATPLTPNTNALPSTTPGTNPQPSGNPPQARKSLRDQNLIAATFQVPATPTDRQDRPPDVNVVVPANPGAGDFQEPQPIPRADRIFNRPNASQDEVEQIQQRTADFAAVLSEVQIEVSQATAAGLPNDSRPYVVNPAQALQLGLVNNRNYQWRLENIYLQSLAVTLARFNFEPQFYAGMSPSTAPGGGFPFTGNGNQFVYRTAATGFQQSGLTLSEAAGFGKLFTYGGRLAMGFANSVVFNFIGNKPQQPTVASSLPLSFAQPFLKGGGRAVIMEPLTQAERTLLYELRTFARARQQFFVSMLTQNQADGGGGTNDPNPGFLSVVLAYQQAENARITVAAFQRALEIYREYAKNSAASGISPLQVDQIDLNYRTNQQTLIQTQIAYRNVLDQYKQQIGIPPDVPLILDLSVISEFRSTLRDLLEWQKRPGHDPKELPSIVSGLPLLETIVLDGRPLFEYADEENEKILKARYSESEKLEEYLLVGERIALENRLDLMNQRATLYDLWRQLEVTANGLLPVFNVSMQYQMLTPATTSNPFGFNAQSNLTSLSFNSELPLIRVSERNAFRLALLNYQRGRRALMNQEDSIKNQIRQEIRALIQLSETYEIAKSNLINTLRQRDQSLQQIIAPPAGGNVDAANAAVQTTNFITAVSGVLSQLNSLILFWVQYETARLVLYRDLGIMPFDEWEAYYELFPAPASGNNSRPRGGQPAPAGIPNPNGPPQGRGA